MEFLGYLFTLPFLATAAGYLLVLGGITGSILALMGQIHNVGQSFVQKSAMGFGFGILLTLTGLGAVFIPITYAWLTARTLQLFRERQARLQPAVAVVHSPVRSR
jgi:hypothetical protein